MSSVYINTQEIEAIIKLGQYQCGDAAYVQLLIFHILSKPKKKIINESRCNYLKLKPSYRFHERGLFSLPRRGISVCD